MTTPMTRRELRELERAGTSSENAASGPNKHPVLNQVPFQDKSTDLVPESTDQIEVESPPMSRRQMREQGLLGPSDRNSTPHFFRGINSEASAHEKAADSQLPSRRSLRHSPASVVEDSAVADVDDSAVASVEDHSRLSAIEAPEEHLFTGANLFAEPSTQSIILEGMTEAISLPMDTGEIFTTGSISIVSDPATGTHTAGFDLDGISQGQESVFGVVSTVSPISALDLIDQRASIGVVPQSVLRRGWWKPWALAVCALVLAIAAILASITILGAIGG
jgi:hypothetical protein